LDREALREKLLEDLIVDARDAERPERLPGLRSLALQVAADPGGHRATLDRLAEDDVPAGLRIAFAGELPLRSEALRGVVDSLLSPLLRGEDPGAARAALDVLRARGRTRVQSWGACGCAFGFLPADAGSLEEMLFLAFVIDPTQGSGIAWDPLGAAGDSALVPGGSAADGAALDLKLRRVPEGGASLLTWSPPAANSGGWEPKRLVRILAAGADSLGLGLPWAPPPPTSPRPADPPRANP
jgi:hypothetical protein